MYDLLGRFKHEDIRDRSVHALIGRYNADAKQAERVVQTAQNCLMMWLVISACIVKTVIYFVVQLICMKWFSDQS